LFAGGHLSGGTALTRTMLNYIPRENQHFYKAVMMLVLTDKQKALLRTKKKEIPRVDVTQLENTLHSIDEACKKKMADLEGKKVGKTKATMTGLGSCYIAWKRKQKPKQQTNKLTSFMSRIVEAVSPSKRKK
jgi:4-diphosphocytidyl-2C-methyl-D-erythritol kinase